MRLITTAARAWEARLALRLIMRRLVRAGARGF
jgi:hypothetical protein